MTCSAVVGAGRARAWFIAGVAAAVLAFIAPAAGAATASSSYGYLASFGSAAAMPYNPQYNSVAVDGSGGNILVAEIINLVTQSPTLQVYSPDPAAGGVPLTSIDLNAAGVLPVNIAVDPGNGSVYVIDDSTKAIHRLLSDGAPVPTYTPDSSFASPPGLITSPGGLTVDPVTHEVLVGDRNANRVYRLDATGALVSSFDGSNTADGRFATAGSLAVGPTGTAYVVDDLSARVERFSADGTSLGALPITAGGTPSVIAVQPQSGEIAVLVSRQGQTFIEGFDATGQRAFSSRVSSQAAGSPVGLAWDAGTDRIYLGVNDGTVHTLVPATQPGVDAPVISQITPTSAHVVADIAAGGEPTTARIEYCPATAACAGYLVSDPNDPANPWVRLPDHAGLSGNGQETIADDLTGLSPNTSYRIRAQAANALTDSTSAASTFVTPLVPPVVQTGPAGAVTDTEAELTGTIDTVGAQTTYHFEYGLTTNYGAKAPAGAEGVAGNSRTPRTFARTITGLQPGTTYHYRLVARNAAGEAVGDDRTFVTQGADTVAPGRGYEQVTPVNKRGASVNTFGFQVAADGSAIEYILAAVSSDAASSALAPRYMSRRGATDWLDWQQLDPPLNVSREIIESVTHAVSPDFMHALVVSNRVLAPGASENGGNLYVVDLRTRAYSLVGTVPGLTGYLSMAGVQTANMYLAGAPDFSWVVFASRLPLLPGVSGPALYKWTRAGGLTLESRLPGGGVPSGSVSMQTKGVLTTREASDDGNTMAFALTSGEKGVYRRTNGQTTAISVSQIPGDPSTPQPGELDGMSRDGRYVIFRSGQLTADAPAVPTNLAPANLYQYDAVTGDLRFLGQVNNAEQGRVIGIGDDAQTVYFNDFNNTAVWRRGELRIVTPDHPDNNAEGMQGFPSPNGRFLAYLGSDGNAHLYDAETDEAVCISCPVDGQVGGDAAFTPGFRSIANRAPQVVTDGGMVFFDSASRLVSADHNGTRDVYSYRNGRLTLISAGDGNFIARFADASVDGSSVFFTTAEPLVGQDTDQALDLYNARIGGGFPGQSPPAPPAPCSKTDCAEPGPGPVSSPPVTSPPQPSGPAKPRTNEKRVTLALTKVSIGAKSMRISFRASQQGRVKVTGSRVATTVRNVAKAGTYVITVRLSRKAQAMRRAHQKLKVSVKVSLSGGWGSASAKYSRTLGK